MAQGFRWTRRGYAARLEAPEARLLRGLLRDVIALLESRRDEARGAGESAPPEASEAATRDDDPFWTLVGGLDLSAERGPRRAAPDDAALARLLPEALPQATPEEQAEHRALAEDDLIAAKLDDARRALAALQSTQVLLPHGQAAAFARALNDVRLVLAVRLGLETQEDARRVHAVDDWRRADDVESTMALLYNFTSWFLETLMEEMLTELPVEGAEGTAGADGADT